MSFDKNDRAAIEAALRDTDANNPIAVAVSERIAKAEENGKLPTEVMLVKPETAFDDIVIRLTLQEIADTTGSQVSIHWV